MSDQKTLDHYASQSSRYAKQYEAMLPQRLYDLAKVYFKLGGETVDIGAGTGRGCQWG